MVQNLKTNEQERPKGLAHEAFPRSGDLTDKASRLLLEELHQCRFSGWVQLQLKEKKKKLWFVRGEVFRIQSNMLPELLGKMMVDRSWLTEEELRERLQFQKTQFSEQGRVYRIGELISESHSIDEDELQALLEQQQILSFLQALTWTTGTYEIQDLSFSAEPKPLFSFAEVIESVKSLFEVEMRPMAKFFDRIEAWQPEMKTVDLSQVSLWSILANCRRLNLNGVLSVRRQNRLFEVVVKYGIPLTLYEGTFGQPRQTIVVRQASEEHERYFIEQLFKLFSFLTGHAYFRGIREEMIMLSSKTEEEEGSLQFRELREEGTRVTKNFRADDLTHRFLFPFLRGAFQLRVHSFLIWMRVKSLYFRMWRGLKNHMISIVKKDGGIRS